MKVQIVGCTINSSGNDQRKENAKTSELKHYYPELSYRVCIHHLMPMRSCCSAVFLDKSLCISLEELAAGARRVQAPLYRSALSCQLGLPSLCRSTADKETDKNKGDRIGNFDKSDGQEHRLEHRGSSISKPHRRKATQKERTCGVNSKDHDSEKPSYSTFWGLSFREPSASNTKTTQHKGNANEAAFSPLSNFRHMDHSFTFIPVHSGMISKLEQESGKSTEPQIISTFHRRSSLKNDSVGGTIKTLSLKEALELFRPEFISRSKGRVRRLEQKASRRKALRDSHPDLVQDLIVAEDKQKRKCTKPDPLSDNLFKPRERFISGREMQLRSRRIYNKLPEVTKKKEEEKRRAVSEMNRVRAEVFKKRLLDKILQR